jgi:hypothetical protein
VGEAVPLKSLKEGNPLKTTLSVRVFLILSALFLYFFSSIGCHPGEDGDAVSANSVNLMENRIRQIEDREEIERLLMDYGRFLDQRDFGSFSRLFSEEEGEWIGGMGKARGRQAIQELMDEKIGPGTGETDAPNFHLFMNDSIDMNGDRASALSKWVFVIQSQEGQPQPFYLGHYEDQLVREKGHWKFLKRVVYTDIPKDVPEP